MRTDTCTDVKRAADTGRLPPGTDVFWAKRGYRVVAGFKASFSWQDLDEAGAERADAARQRGAIIHCVDLKPPVYDVYVLRSTAMSFWKWLAHAGVEFGLGQVAAS